MLAIGTKAPDFTLPDQNGEMKSLADYRGQKVILYFYPKDMTAGCTKQACAFGELYPQFREKDAVEEALCFGWIDSTVKPVDGVTLQRFSPRQKNALWTELNKERVRRLERLGLMTDAGRAVLPPMGPRSFRVDPEVEKALKQARVWTKFRRFPPLYQRVRAYNLWFYKTRLPDQYEASLAHLIEETKKGRTFGNWNDYGRLTEGEET